MMKKDFVLKILTAALALMIVNIMIIGCGEEPDLPVAVTNPGNFGANDTTFVRLSPDWDASSHGWDQPIDIQFGRDKYVYVLDKAAVGGFSNGRVTQLRLDGEIIRDTLFARTLDTTQAPLGIGQDSKLNLFVVNGTDNVYLWNQYNADRGISVLIQTITMYLPDRDTTIILTNDRPLYAQLEEYDINLAMDSYQVIDATGTDEPDSVRKVEQPYVVYNHEEPFWPDAEITSVNSDADAAGVIYLSDRVEDRIFSVEILQNRMVVLDDSSIGFSYTSRFGDLVVSFGQGQASTNNPTSIAVEALGSQHGLYFCQTSGNFLVQKVAGLQSIWNFDFSQAGSTEPEVLQLGYFGAPLGIAIGSRDELGLGIFYVADSLQNRVPAFHPNGYFFREVAYDESFMTMSAYDTLSSVLEYNGYMLEDWNSSMNPNFPLDYIAEADTTVRLYFPILNGPKDVATFEGIVYIADTGNNRILRFSRTDLESYLPDDGD